MRPENKQKTRSRVACFEIIRLEKKEEPLRPIVNFTLAFSHSLRRKRPKSLQKSHNLLTQILVSNNHFKTPVIGVRSLVVTRGDRLQLSATVCGNTAHQGWLQRLNLESNQISALAR
jgi:hypothetical protein